MPRRRASSVACVALFVVAFGIAFWMVRPIATASIGPDAAAPVVHFERLVAGQRLDGHLTQTSKPLLTAVYGVLYATGRDWRPVAWAAIAAFALSVVAAAILAERVAGLTAAAFVAVGFLLSPVLLRDVSLADALSWAVLGWLVAGLAVTSTRPRWTIAGAALLLAALARPEGLAVVAFSFLALLAIDVVCRLRRRGHPPPAAYLIAIGFLAIPILMTHDALLTGDAFFWAKTAVINSAHATDVRGFVATIAWVAHHVVTLAPLLPLAALGALAVALRRQWALAIGLAAVGVGIPLLFAFSGARGVNLSTRYLGPIDLALVFSAGLGLSLVDVPAVRRRIRSRVQGVSSPLLPLAVGAAIGFALAPMWPLDPVVRTDVAEQVALHAHAHEAIGRIRAALGPSPSWRGAPASTGISPRPLVIVPPRLRVQAVLDLDLPLTAVAPSLSASFDPSQGRPGPGTIVFHDRIDDHRGSSFAAVEAAGPTVVGGVRYVPVVARPSDGWWIARTEPASGP